MSRQRIGEFTDSLVSGVYKDPPNKVVPLWEDGKNIVFERDGPRPVFGFSNLFPRVAGGPVRGVLQAWINGTRYIFFGNDANLYRYNMDSDTVTEISKATDAYSGSFWSFVQWGDWVLADNGVDPIQVYKGTAFADLSTDLGTTPVADMLDSFKAHVIAFGTDSEGRELRWCDQDDINTWDPKIANAAGSLFIRDLDSPVRAEAATSGGIIFYGDSTAHLLRWTGPPFYFGAEIIKQNIGVFGKYAVTNVGNTHFGMGNDGIWMFSPQQGEQYIDAPLHDFIYDNLDYDNAHKCVAWYDESQRLVVFSYPHRDDESGEPQRSVALSLDQRAWCPLDFAATGASQSPVFQYTTAFDLRGNPYSHGVPGAGGGGLFDVQQFISFSDDLTIKNYYGISGYGQHGYGGP